LMVAAAITSLYLESALQAFNILLSVGAGTGLLFILRWFWWRISAWSEITAMLVSFIAAVYFNGADLPGWEPWEKLVAPIAVTAAAWLLVTFIAPSTSPERLAAFYQLVRPAGPGWRRVRNRLAANGDLSGAGSSNLSLALLCVLAASVGVYSLLFAIGYVIYGQLMLATGLAAIAAVAAFIIWRSWDAL
ncbi:MAG: Na+:solute symporter, partial [Halioglobus sp.]|nr:Na+:solute symporter [Halioglobus sp.]